MSLHEAVLDIVSDMEEAVKLYGPEGNYTNLTVFTLMNGYIVALKAVVKASPKVELLPPMDHIRGIATIGHGRDSYYQRTWAEIEEQKAVQQARRQAQAQEDSEGRMTELVGGDVDGTFVNTPQGMPQGAKTIVSGCIYQLQEDMKLHYLEEETLKRRIPT